jgi:hypothetical protein
MDLHIDHLDCQYFTGQPLVEQSVMQRRLDTIAQSLLAQVWSEWLSTAPTAGDGQEAYYFIDQMTVQLNLDLATDNRTLAKTWARALHQDILRSLAQRKQGIIIFPNRSEFLASFVIALMQGTVWEQWYYQEFEGLRSQSLGQIILTVLTQEGDIGRDTLMTLTQQGNLDILLSSLTDPEVETLVARCLLPPSPRVALVQTYGVWVQALKRYLVNQPWGFAQSVARNLAYIYLSLLRQQPELGPDVNLARFLQELLTWHQALVTADSLPSVLELLTAENLPAVMSYSSPPIWLAPLVGEVGGQELANLLQDMTPPASQGFVQRQLTAYGGVFLLIPTILELELTEFFAACPYREPENGSKVSWLLFAIALQCLGSENLETALADPALAMFAGLSQGLSWENLTTYGNTLASEQHLAFRQAFQSHLERLYQDTYRATLLGGIADIPAAHRDQIRLATENNGLGSPWDDALIAVSGIILHSFATRLGAFAGSSPSYLRRNILESQAVVERRTTELHVRFLSCPLQMVLRMVGLDSDSWQITWTPELTLTFEFE